MHIQHVEIGNFRKLQAVRIDFAEATTIFVGANNSGKTSAMEALKRFLIDREHFSVNDITLSHWAKLDELGCSWESGNAERIAFDWEAVLPFVDVWLNVPKEQLHYVQKLLPTLDWNAAIVGVRLRYEPKDLEALQRDYLTEKLAADAITNASSPEQPTPDASPPDQRDGRPTANPSDEFALWPRTFMDFLARRLRSVFEVRAYILDPAQFSTSARATRPQALRPDAQPIVGDPFEGLMQIDEVDAQRGLGFPRRRGGQTEQASDMGEHRGGRKLSSQLRSYYTKHLDPFNTPEPQDLHALQALHSAQVAFGNRLADCFSVALKELEDIGYPGVTDPKLRLTTRVQPIDGLNHPSAIQYEVPTNLSASSGAHCLPEDTNGLGYQNLISIVFHLMSFRDSWMKVGKAGNAVETETTLIAPLHLVLIEEPEAHLHPQVQQVFINQAYKVLRNHAELGETKERRTQLVISTHSSHIAHEADFAALRYFRRLPAPSEAGAVPISEVANLSDVFGDEGETERFVRRYLKAMHCDLFFADGAVLVEGPAERILIPHLVRSRSPYNYLTRCYLTWLEIGGSHAHRLKSLLVRLGLTTLIVTDLDAKEGASSKKAVPARNANLKSRNETLKTWIPGEESIDTLLDMNPEALAHADPSGYAIRVAYQQPVLVKFKSSDPQEALANTFEDALLYENLEVLAKLDGTGLITKFQEALSNCANLSELAESASNALSGDGKAQFALDLLFSEELKNLTTPAYIHDGLLWLIEQLKRRENEVIRPASGEEQT
ncbi:MAG TPA: AAA family ATPase [Burkholderiales bacterium]|nr:AAA family ATPase [Burkholderiales bacterium]